MISATLRNWRIKYAGIQQFHIWSSNACPVLWRFGFEKRCWLERVEYAPFIYHCNACRSSLGSCFSLGSRGTLRSDILLLLTLVALQGLCERWRRDERERKHFILLRRSFFFSLGITPQKEEKQELSKGPERSRIGSNNNAN